MPVVRCPKCGYESKEGVKFCAECSAALDPETLRLGKIVKAEVERHSRKIRKGQNDLERDASLAVFERVLKWNKLLLGAIAIPLILWGGILGVFGYHKFTDIDKVVEAGEKEIEEKIENAKTRIGQASDVATAKANAATAKADAATAKAEESLHTTATVTATVNRSGQRVTADLSALSSRVNQLETKTTAQMLDSTKRVEADVAQLHRQVDATTKEMAEQQKQLANTNASVKSIFSKGTTQYFQTVSDSASAIIVTPDIGRHKLVWMFMLLSSAPIPQTVELKWKVAAQPRASYWVLRNNAVVFNWGEPVENLRQNPLEVTYIPDPTATDPAFKALSVHDGAVYADGILLQQLPQIPSASK